MPKQFDTFLNSQKSSKQAEMILRDLNEKLERGEILTQEELQQQLAEQLQTVESRGRITFEVPVAPGNVVVAERLERFFKELAMDVEILFTEVDATDRTLANMANVIETQLRNLEFNLGQLRSELIERRVKIPPGSGWSKIVRDSFERGYGQLLGRAELPYDLFKDVRTGLSQDGEANPIKADAKIEGVAKKLILPEIDNRVVGFREATLNRTASSTSGNLDLGDETPLYRAIDQSTDTFWSMLVANSQPLLGTPTAEVTQVAGPSTGSTIMLNLSGLQDPRQHDYFVQLVNTSGNQYRCFADLTQQVQARNCIWDTGNRCQWDYDTLYSLNCTNNNCSRYEARLLEPTSGIWGPLEDGFEFDTGAQLAFSGTVREGQTWRVTVSPSGMVGAVAELQLELSQPGHINWFELDPVSESPFKLVSVDYTRPGTSGRLPITSGTLEVGDRVRLDFPSIEADSIYLTIQQENYIEGDFLLRQDQVARSRILRMRDQLNAPSIEEFYEVGAEHLLAQHLPNGPLRDYVDARGDDPEKIQGYIYQVGVFNATCGHTSYKDTAVAVTRATRVVTPRMFAVVGDLEPAISYASGLQSAPNGTLEFSVVRLNYDANGTLINIEDFPVPRIREGLVHERLFIDSDRTGQLRFAADEIDSVEVLSLGRTLTEDEYEVTETTSPVTRTTIQITRQDVSQTAIVLVKYTLRTGVFLNQERNLVLEDNSNNELSISPVSAIVVADSRAANRDIEYSDVHLRIILRRNDPDIYTTPGLRDYQLLISEADPGRFF